MSMGRFASSMDPRSGLEVVRDWNGVAQVVLRSPKGASARVGLPTADLFTDRWAWALGIACLGVVLTGFCRCWIGWFALQVSLHGGQVVYWRNDRGEDLLFTSSKVTFSVFLSFISPPFIYFPCPVICNTRKFLIVICGRLRPKIVGIFVHTVNFLWSSWGMLFDHSVGGVCVSEIYSPVVTVFKWSGMHNINLYRDTCHSFCSPS